MLQQSDADLKKPLISLRHPSQSRTALNRVASTYPAADSAAEISKRSVNLPSTVRSHNTHYGKNGIFTETDPSSNYLTTPQAFLPTQSQSEAEKVPLEVRQPPPVDKELLNGNSTNGNGKIASPLIDEDWEKRLGDREKESPLISTEMNGAISPPKSPEAEPEPEKGFLPVLRNRNFLALWMGQVFSQLADKVYLVLMIALIDSHFQSANQPISAWVSGIMMAFTIPAVLFGSLAGVFVDRWPKQAVLVSTNLLRGGLVISLPLLLWLAEDWGTIKGLPAGFLLLLLVTFLVSTLTQFFAPAEQAAIPLVVEKRHLLSANSLYTTTMMASVIIGFAVGQPVLDLADTLLARIGGWGNGKELVVGGSYAIAGLILLLLKTNEKTASSEQEPPHVLADLRDGFLYLKEQRRIRTALLQLVILFSIFAALSVVAVPLAEKIPGIKASQFGFLMASGGVGMGIGAALLGHFGHGVCPNWLSLVGSVGVAASLTGLALLPHHLWLVLLLVMFLGGFGALVAVPMQTAIQKETPPEMRGKVFGLQNNGINIALTLPLALAGVAETFFGLQAVFLTLGAIAIAGGLFTWYICPTEGLTSRKSSTGNG